MSRAQRVTADSSGWNPAHDGQKSERSERFWPTFGIADVDELTRRAFFSELTLPADSLSESMWSRCLHDITYLSAINELTFRDPKRQCRVRRPCGRPAFYTL